MDIQGHRGCRGLFPENSLPAFEKAIDLGVTTLELDIVLSKDLKVVVSHEPYMNNIICSMPDGGDIDGSPYDLNLFQMTYDSIKRFDCGTKFHPNFPEQEKIRTYKPLLSEVFDLARTKGSNVWFNIEIKSLPKYYGTYTPYPEEYVKTVMELIANQDMQDRVNLQSFDINILEEIHEQYPDIAIALLIDESESMEVKLESLSFKPEIISPYFKLLDNSTVENFQELGYKVIPWTVNDTTDLITVSSWKVDGIITDYPDRLLELRNN